VAYYHRLFKNLIATFKLRHIDRQRIIATLLALLIIFALAPIPLYLVFKTTYAPKITDDVEEVEIVDTGIVLGSKLDDGQMTDALRARLDAAYTLYEAGKVSNLIVSGGGEEGLTEADVMAAYLITKGVPESAIKLEKKSLSTLQNCEMTREDYGIKNAILISQGEHLTRAIYLCDAVGIKSRGFAAGGSYSQVSFFYEAYALAIDIWRVML
jgi:vancomycin permeability regulator SanA